MGGATGGGGGGSAGTYSPRQRAAAELLSKWTLDATDVEREPTSIGGGGQADVFRGRWQGVDVVLKCPRTSSAAHQQAVGEFVRREIRALARVQHPNVVKLYGCLTDPPAVILAFVEGGPLTDHIDVLRGAPDTTILSLLRGIASGMAAVHSHNLVHLDLKPDNVLMSAHGTPIVTDFGFAASTASQSFSNSAGGRGTLKYKAPELFRTKKKGGAVVSPKADVYSFAVLGWQVGPNRLCHCLRPTNE